MSVNGVIYLDYSATTPCDPRVVEVMIPYFSEIFGNPNSSHAFGTEALNALNFARHEVASLLNSEDSEIVFTGGSTESTNIAVERVAEFFKKSGKSHIITVKTEHKAVLDAFDKLQRKGFQVTFLDVMIDGLLEEDSVRNAITDATSLVSVMLVNNETGVIHNIKKIAQVCKEHGVLLHTDATQAVGKIPIDVKDLGCDFLSGSGHKIYGPKGIGCLFFKKEHLRILKVINANNDVEFGIRSGTIPVALCVGFGEAAKIAKSEMEQDYNKIKHLQEMLVSKLTNELPEVYINGSLESYYPGITDISFRGVEGEALMMEASRIAVSSGSACTSNRLSISHVLDAMGIAPDIAQSSLRISIGRLTSEEDIQVACENLINATKKLRGMSPIWDMIVSGIDVNGIFKDRKSCSTVKKH